MKKNKFLAILLSAVLALSLSVPALAIDGGLIEGEGGVHLPTLNVVVPTTLDFALDPLKTDEDTPSQIVDDSFRITNNTVGASILAAFYLDATLADDVTLGTDVGKDEANYALDATDKDLELGLIAATAIADDVVSYDATKTATIISFAEVSDVVTASIGFNLDAKDGTTAATAFSFYGVMNAYADWKAGDVSVEGVYLLRALSSETDVETVEGSLGLVDTSKTTLPDRPGDDAFEPAAPAVGFLDTSKGADAYTSTAHDVSKTGTTASSTLAVKFNAGDETIVVKSTGGNVQELGTVYTFDDTTDTLTVLGSKLTSYASKEVDAINVLNIYVGEDTTPYVLTFKTVA